jgi:alkylhydroperoxidase family enzyme
MAEDGIDDDLRLLVAQSPPGLQPLVALVRTVCGGALGLPSLPSETSAGEGDPAVEEFAEQFSTDVSVITDDQRAALFAAIGPTTFPAVVQMYIADFLPRIRVGLQALGLPVPWREQPPWDHTADAGDVLFTRLLPGVARLRALDPITTEVVRLRGAVAHHCRLCTSLREGAALDAGGSETLYDDIADYPDSRLLSAAHKAALHYADALIWTPAHIDPAIADDVLRHFSAAQARELTLDVARNASNKIAVALKADAPRVEQGTERYLIDADGQTVFSSRSL